MISCINTTPQIKPINENMVLGGNHELRRFNVKDKTTTESSGVFFLLIGGFNSKTITETTVRFYFLNYGKEYQFMELPLNKINIKIDNSIQSPYIKFGWYGLCGSDNWRNYYDDVYRAVIYCKDTDFQPEININDLR